MSTWFITDPDCLQCCNPIPSISSIKYEFCQINSFTVPTDAKPLHQVAHATIDFKDFSEEEILDALTAYGYEDMDDFVFQTSPGHRFKCKPDGTLDPENSPDYIIDHQLIAEMLFETNIQKYIVSEHWARSEAAHTIEALTGLSLGQYFKEEKAPAPNASDCLIIGDRQDNDGKHTAFICTPAELSVELKCPVDKLMQQIRNTRENLGQGVFHCYLENGKMYNVCLAEQITEKPLEASEYLAWIINKNKLDGLFLDCDLPSGDTIAVLSKLIAPVRSAGLTESDRYPEIMDAIAFREDHKDYVNDLSDIFSTFHLIDVTRERQSVTQGTALITFRDAIIVRYGDDMYLQKDDGTFTNGFRDNVLGQHHGLVIAGWGSIISNQHLVGSALTQYPARITRAMESYIKKHSLTQPSLDSVITNAQDRVCSPSQKATHDKSKER